MRHLIAILTTGSALVGAALLVTACGHHGTPANSADTNMTDMTTMDSSAGTTNHMSGRYRSHWRHRLIIYSGIL